MPRRRLIRKRELPADTKYNDPLVTKLINYVMKNGKKSIAERITYSAFEIIHKKTKKDPLEVFQKALNNVQPDVEVKSRRVGGATYQVPVPVPPDRKVSLALRWIVSYARMRPGKSMVYKLSSEILEAYEEKGSAIKKRDDVHKMAAANKAFAHYRW